MKRILYLFVIFFLLVLFIPNLSTEVSALRPNTDTPIENIHSTEQTIEDFISASDALHEYNAEDVYVNTEGNYAVISGSTTQLKSSSSTLRFETVQEAGEYLRDGFVNRSFSQVSDYRVETTIAIPTSLAIGDPASQLSDIILSHTKNPKGGDFLIRNGALLFLSSYEEDHYSYFTVAFEYAFTHAEDKELDTAVQQLLDELDVYDASEYEKVRAIYDWICLNVQYDHTLTNYDAHSALCEKNTVCQGYSTLFYRLCLELGVDSRYCGGYSFNEFGKVESHGWNIVHLDGKWYFVDTTWGAGLIEEEPDYYYFLKGVDGIQDHLIPSSRWDDEIGNYCTVAADDYPIPEKQIIINSGFLSDTIYYELTKARVLTISGTGSLLYDYSNPIWFPHVAEVIIGEGIYSIGPDMFFGEDLVTVSLPASLVEIGTNAFSRLVNIHIPENLKNLEPGALSPSTLNSITISPENPYYEVIDGCLFTEDMKTLVYYAGIWDNTNECLIEEYFVPNGVETIGAYAFNNQDTLRNITFSNTVKHIEEYAFENCTYAEVPLTDSIISIGDRSLEGCNAVSEFYIGKNVEHIGKFALLSDTLQSVTVHPSNQYYTSVDGVLFSNDLTKLIRYPVNRSSKTYSIPEGVLHISDGAFAGFESTIISSSNLENIALPQSLLSIGESAFSGQSHIKGLILPFNLQTIGKNAFEGSIFDSTIIIPDSVRTIEERAFFGNTANKIWIGKDVRYIGKEAFAQIGYSPENYNEHIKVYFNASEDCVIAEHKTETLFGFNPTYDAGKMIMDPANQACLTIYFPINQLDMRSANHITKWLPDPNNYWQHYTFGGYHEDANGEIHELNTTIEGVQCTEPIVVKHICTKCNINYTYTSNSSSHDWVEVNCDYPPYCKNCFSENGQNRGHSYNMSYEGNVCTGFGYEVGVCTNCGNTFKNRINLIGHDWMNATCTVPKTCKTCGVKDGDVVHAYAHEFDYKCDSCGKERTVDMTRPMVDMFRMYNPNTGEHFYTGSTVERDNLISVGWQYEGIGFTFPLTTGKPVYRLFEPITGEHLYTMDEAEKEKLMSEGWNYEGIAFNSGFENEVPQFRLHNPNATVGAYHFTASTEERDTLLAAGWEYQGIGWYSLGA